MRGRVLHVAGLQVVVEVDGEEWQCEVRGRLKAGRRRTNFPIAAGDWVEVQATAPGHGVVEAVHPRSNKISRLASGARAYEQVLATNLDQLIVVVATRQPALRAGFIDRALAMALKGGVPPVLCITKADLDPQGAWRTLLAVYEGLGCPVHVTSATTGEGVAAFATRLRERVSALVGYSGVGKSSLLNSIDPNLQIRTQEMMKKHDRGRHTTAAVRLHRLAGGGYVADTPGIKELQLWEVPRAELAAYFPEMAPLLGQCRFRDCLHLHEPDCAIRRAVETGHIAPIRYEGYRRIAESLEKP